MNKSVESRENLRHRLQNMELIDSHCHLEKFARSQQLSNILKNAEDAHIAQLISVGTHIADWPLYHELAMTHPEIIAWTVGIHPCHVESDWHEQGMAISVWFADACPPVALGEIGLDYYHLPKSVAEADIIKKRQREAFAYQLSLAFEIDCPVIIHSRNAFQDCLEMIDQSGIDWKKVVFHCFSEGPEEVSQLNQRGGRASFTGIVTYKSADNVRQAMLTQGLDHLMIETDAPYLTPVPHRGKPCEPAHLKNTAEYSAQLFGISLEAFSQATTANTRRFFELNNR